MFSGRTDTPWLQVGGGRLSRLNSTHNLGEAHSRRSRCKVTGLEVVVGEVSVDAAGERRGRSGKNLPDQARAMRQDECIASAGQPLRMVQAPAR